MAEFSSKLVSEHYAIARELFALLEVDTEQALSALAEISISMQCWQGDDVCGFEQVDTGLTGGIQATGNFPGKARNGEELRADLDMAMSLIPGKHRVNLHAIYAETDGAKVERNELEPIHFARWLDWAKDRGIGLDFNPTCFSHPLCASGFTLSHPDSAIRQFWIEHCKASRKIGEYFGRQLGRTCVTNIWIPDGYKDMPIDRFSPRQRLKNALDEIFSEEIPEQFNLDSVESKLFGIGSESYVVGSNEFYLGYAIQNRKLLCLDTGHFHPTEVVSDKLSAVFNYLEEILLHVSRPVRWDSDHVVILDDELGAIAHELVRNDFLSRTHIGLDFFDASINRVTAWVIGTRNMVKALLIALLEPTQRLKALEVEGDFTSRLAMLEEVKSLPWGAVWAEYCQRCNVPANMAWLGDVQNYERRVMSKRQ